MDADITLSDVRIAPMGEITVKVTVTNDRVYDNMHRPIAIRSILPEGFCAEHPKSLFLPRWDSYHYNGKVSFDAVIRAGETVNAENRVILEITSPGRPTALYASFVLLG